LKIRLAAALRVLGFVLGGIFAVVAALALMVWISFDADSTTNMLAHHFKERYQRVLTLDAPPQLRMWPRPVLVLHGVSLSEKGGEDLFAKAKEIRLTLSPLGLVLHHPEVTQIAFDSLELTLQRPRSAGWNLASLFEEPVMEVSPLPWQLKPEEIIVHGGVLHLDDARENIKADWKDVALSASDLASQGPGRLSMQGQWRAVAGEVDFHFALDTRFVIGEHLEAGSLEAVRLVLEGNDRQLKGATARLESANLNWSDAGAAGQIGQSFLKLQGAWGHQNLEVAATARQLGWKDWQLEGTQFENDSILREVGGQTRLKVAIPQLAGRQGGFDAAGLEVSWQSQYAGRGSEGTLHAKLGADVRAGNYTLNDLKTEATLKHPRLQGGGTVLKLSGKAGWSTAGSSEAHLQAAAGDQKLQADVVLAQTWPIQGQLNLDSARMDLDRVLTRSAGKDDLVPTLLAALNDVSLKGRMHFGALKTGGVQIDNLSVPFDIKDAVVDAKGITVGLYGGQLAGDLSTHIGSGSIEASGEFHDVTLDRLVRDAGAPVLLTGRASGSYHLATRLARDVDPLAALTGALRWNVTGAGLRGVDLMRSLHVFRPAIEAGKQSARTPMDAESTDLGVASSRFVFTDGMIQAETLQTRNSWLALSGSGNVSLLHDELDFNLQAALQPGIASTAAKDLMPLRVHPLGLRLKGARLHPDVRYEPGQVPTTLAAAGKKK
jgi:uncharacterized protein involved in outer membrane biogenesis